MIILSDSGTGSGGRIIAVSGDDTYVVQGRKKLLTSNLSSDLGTFPESIYLLNFDGSMAIGRNNVYDANTFSILKAVPVSTTTMAFSADERTVFLYDSSSSRIFLFDPFTQ